MGDTRMTGAAPAAGTPSPAGECVRNTSTASTCGKSTPPRLGIDVGSTTVKVILLDTDGTELFRKYVRHGSATRQTLADILAEVAHSFPSLSVIGAVTGSAALDLPTILGLPFVQEVIASSRSIRKLAPQTDVAIELGGEDAKILYFGRSIDLRMNEACAGGTGAFIDQMAALLDTDASGLNALAAKSDSVLPIASRCGVFAKTDVVALLNEGASRETLAVSVLQAVVEQTISGLACGHPIKGNVAFVGGPLHFIPELVRRFVATLHLTEDQTLTFENGQYMVAMGAAFSAEEKDTPTAIEELVRRLTTHEGESSRTETLPPLFASEDEYEQFRARHAKDSVRCFDLKEAKGDLFLGIDLGSTTVKTVLADEAGDVVAMSYSRNDGNPLQTLLPYLIDLLEHIPPAARLRACGTTGYGAGLAKTALDASLAEVETVAHLKAACQLMPDTTYVIDIGGQDMKCMQVDDGAVADIRLNEACSSGCGAFLQTFAASLGMEMQDFVQAALHAPHPVDLGSRCTVFMNSKVKQAQKEGATIPDIAAGLCYSVVRNALYKVLRLRSTDELGEHVVVQGGSFLNDALLRAMENMLGRSVCRPNIAGHMGAYGMALLCLQHRDTLPPCTLTADSLKALSFTTKATRCNGCGNRCHLVISKFSTGKRLITGNRCDKGIGLAGGTQNAGHRPPSIYAWKEKHLFSFEPLPENQAPRGRLGIPRVLNIYERYPFWFRLFTDLGFRVELSPASKKSMYSLGLAAMPSQTVCYPAKISHGHIAWLLQQGLPRIFFPCIPREIQESNKAVDRYSCPVACGYPEVIRLNTPELRKGTCEFIAPYLNPADDKSLIKEISKAFAIPAKEVARAVAAAHKEQDAYRNALHAEARRIIHELSVTGGTGIVLAGRPYHVDPLVHHGIPELITSLGAAVLSEDSIAWMANDTDIKLRVVDQWSFPGRLYRAASVVADNDQLELVQLTSFGCGIEAVTTDQVAELLHAKGRMHTVIKIDEGPSLGAARIRIRSLLATIDERRARRKAREEKARRSMPPEAPVFSVPMRTTHTVLCPQMSPIHLPLMEAMFQGEGINFQLLPTVSQDAIETGLRYVNNDACYPAQIVIGQLIAALKSGSVDTRHAALMLPQTCGPCRATNYPGLLRKALIEAGFPDISILKVQSGATKDQPGFSMTGKFLDRLLNCFIYGDMLQRLSHHTLTYEQNAGDTASVLDKWENLLHQDFACGKKRSMSDDMRAMVRDFSAIPVSADLLPKVGIVGEILLCYHPEANRDMANMVRHEGGEPVLSDITDFLLYCFSDPIFQWRHLGGKFLPAFFGWYIIQKVERLRNSMRAALAGTRFPQMHTFKDLTANAGKLISLGYQAGEGWLLSAELLKFLSAGTTNALCLQPFGCLPNHVVGRGVFRELKRICPTMNLMAVDYEAGSSEANILNRVKLFMTMSKANETPNK